MFLPVAGLALVVLCIFALLAYRSGLEAITEEERADLVDSAWQAASLLPGDARRTEDLRRALPPESVAALLDEGGRAVARLGAVGAGNLLEPGYPDGTPPREPRTAGPSAETGDRLVAWLPLRNGLVLRVERPAPALAAQWTRWRHLTAVSAFSLAAIATLLVFYLRRLFAPIDSLLEAARQFDGDERERDPEAAPVDELEDLVHRFQQAITQHRANLGTLERSGSERLGRELQAEAAALEQTFSRLESGMALLDLDGRFLALNGVGQTILGLTEIEMPVPMERALAAHDDLRRTLRDAIEKGQVLRRREFTLKFPGTLGDAPDSGKGEEIFVGLSFSPLQREDGTTRGWILLFADLSRARAEATRLQMSTSLSQLAELTAGFAHELRNGLASIQGFASLLARVELPAESARHDFAELQREVDQLHRLVEDFLDFARPGQSRLRDVDLFRLAHRAAGDPALGGFAVRARAQGQGPWSVRGDEHLLHRLVRNLLLNAVRAQRRRGNDDTIEIRLHRDAGGREPRLRLEVLDRGDGLSPEALDTLFVPFASHADGGSGLGLAIAKRIADLHHADLQIENRASGGVRARLSFATAETQSDPAALPVLEPDSGSDA